MTTASAARVMEAIAERERVLRTFLDVEQEALAHACHDLARAFARGGTLLPYGGGSAASDAAHVAVEFLHPVIVGKRALPAVVPPAGDLRALARSGDVALALAHGRPGDDVRAFVASARERGLTTVALTGGEPEPLGADHHLHVPCADEQVVQEVHETAYHVLWELVHVFFEHPGLLEEHCTTCGDVGVRARVTAVGEHGATVEGGDEVATDLVGDVAVGDVLLCHAGVALEHEARAEATAFLYPFLEREEDDLGAVLRDVQASTVRKGEDTIALRAGIDPAAVEACRAALRERLAAGGRLLAFGNGGSATDAQDAAFDAVARGWAAVDLSADSATITAVGNDVGFDNTFARQLIPLARRGDVALGISTSGSSPNVVAGLEQARRQGALTIGIAGYDGGRLAGLTWLDHLLVVRSDYIPRLQEAHGTLLHLLLEDA